MRKLISSFLLIIMALLTSIRVASGEPDPMNLSLDENINVPKVPERVQSYITSAMDKLRRHLAKDSLCVETIRDGEVLQVTYKCSDLFAPCAVDLKVSADKHLHPLCIVANDMEKYKMLVVVHSDDTGDEQYSDSITAARATAIDNYFWHLAGERDTNLIPYGIGMDEPLHPNTSRVNREANRRVEIFIVPDRELLQLAGVKIK